jgi:carbon-monoxide dehydrogenase medium subunit
LGIHPIWHEVIKSEDNSLRDIDYVAPRTVPEAVAILAEKGDRARVLAGGTDIIVQLREHRRDLDVLVDVKNIPEVNELSYETGKGLYLGAAVPCYRFCDDPVVGKIYPGLLDAVSLVGGVQIQSRASVGGNLCNASPAADTIPALIVYKAVCTIAGPKGIRKLPVEEFCTAPGRTALERGEMLLALRLAQPKPLSSAYYERFIPRNEMDIAVVGAAAAVRLDRSKTRCESARLALAAVAPTPLPVPDVAAVLVDGPLSDAQIDKAAAIAQGASRPISDMRGDADYRRHLVGVLTRRAFRAAIARAKEN